MVALATGRRGPLTLIGLVSCSVLSLSVAMWLCGIFVHELVLARVREVCGQAT